MDALFTCWHITLRVILCAWTTFAVEKFICFSERYSFVCYNHVSYFYVFT